jgi:hypothetical protein
MMWREDCVRCAVAVLTGSGHENTAYHVTGPNGETFAEVAQMLSEITGCAVVLEETDDEGMYAHFDALGIPRKPVDDLVHDRPLFRISCPPPDRPPAIRHIEPLFVLQLPVPHARLRELPSSTFSFPCILIRTASGIGVHDEIGHLRGCQTIRLIAERKHLTAFRINANVGAHGLGFERAIEIVPACGLERSGIDPAGPSIFLGHLMPTNHNNC